MIINACCVCPQKPNEVKLTLDQNNRVNATSGNVVFLHQSPLIISPVTNQATSETTSTQELTSPATDALDFLTMDPNEAAAAAIDPHNLLIDLNDLLKRDPTLSTLASSLDNPPAPAAAAVTANVAHHPSLQQTTQYVQLKAGMAIPGTVKQEESKPVLLKIDEAHDLFAGLGGGSGHGQTGAMPVAIGASGDSVGIATTVSSSGGGIMENGSSFGSISPLAWRYNLLNL